MPKIPVTQAPAGPALDAAVAEARGWQILVMDNNAFWVTYGEHDMWSASGYLSLLPDEGWIKEPLPIYGEKGIWNPSTDIAAAWELVEEKKSEIMAKDWVDFCDILKELILPNSGWRDEYALLSGLSPLTITRAYLKAKSIEEIDIPD